MTKERSPRFPSDSLSEALNRAEALYNSAGRSAVTSEVAAQAIGYSSLSGASRTTLAAMAYYGVLQREGDTHRISELGLRLIRPLNDFDKLEAARLAAIRPPAFAQIAKEHGECSQSVLASILLHKGFTEDGARRAARVYKENVAFIEALRKTVPNKDSAESLWAEPAAITTAGMEAGAEATGSTKTVLAQYQVPLGSNHAQITFTGGELVPEDFDALADYVRLFKQQFERKLRSDGRGTAERKSKEELEA